MRRTQDEPQAQSFLQNIASHRLEFTTAYIPILGDERPQADDYWSIGWSMEFLIREPTWNTNKTAINLGN